MRGLYTSVVLAGLAVPALCGAQALSARTPAVVALVCEGSVGSKPRIDAVAACNSFARAFSTSLGRPVVLTVPAAAAKAQERINLTFRQPRRGAIEAVAKGRLRGRELAQEPMAIDVMDRGLRQADVENLAQRMARSLASR